MNHRNGQWLFPVEIWHFLRYSCLRRVPITREIHRILQQKPGQIVIATGLPDDFLLIGFPLLLENGDGSPIRAMAGYEP